MHVGKSQKRLEEEAHKSGAATRARSSRKCLLLLLGLLVLLA